jgi:hypothetical protein
VTKPKERKQSDQRIIDEITRHLAQFVLLNLSGDELREIARRVGDADYVRDMLDKTQIDKILSEHFQQNAKAVP